MDKASNKYLTLCPYLALAFAGFAVFWQVRSYAFINYDDPQYVTANPHVKAGLTRDSVTWAFTTSHAGNWHPLTWLSHMLDCQLFGTNPRWHHLTNLLLHVINTLLLFAVLKRMTHALWQSAFVAAAFALHPLHVQSVAWIAERKDVLSTLFWILTMAAYLRYVEHPRITSYLLTLLALALGLMAKPMLVTLPFVLLLLDYWPLGRLQCKHQNAGKALPGSKSQSPPLFHLLIEKIPLFILVLSSSIITFIVQQKSGAIKTAETFPWTVRLANALISYLTYIGKMIWPSRLAIFYPHPAESVSISHAVLAALSLLAISACAIRLARSHRYLLVGWLWYLGTLVPVIGLVQVGNQAFADRYTYIPLVGLFIIAAWGFPHLLAKYQHRKIVLGTSAVALLLALSICTRIHLRHWRNSISVFEHAIKVTHNNRMAYSNLGVAFLRQRKRDKAITHFTKALQIDPNHAMTHLNLGVALFQKASHDGAIMHFTEALRIQPDLAEAYVNLGIVYASRKKFDEAIKHYNEALRINPDFARARNLIKKTLLQRSKPKSPARPEN